MFLKNCGIFVRLGKLQLLCSGQELFFWSFYSLKNILVPKKHVSALAINLLLYYVEISYGYTYASFIQFSIQFMLIVWRVYFPLSIIVFLLQQKNGLHEIRRTFYCCWNWRILFDENRHASVCLREKNIFFRAFTLHFEYQTYILMLYPPESSLALYIEHLYYYYRSMCVEISMILALKTGVVCLLFPKINFQRNGFVVLSLFAPL